MDAQDRSTIEPTDGVRLEREELMDCGITCGYPVGLELFV